jgi:GNAT superfamily N-acetyltransferase
MSRRPLAGYGAGAENRFCQKVDPATRRPADSATSKKGAPLNPPTIRHAEPSDYSLIIASVDDWWGGRHMADMLPKLFFVHFRNTSFVAEHDGKMVGFVVGFQSQTFPEEAYIHFVGVDPNLRKHGLASALYERFFAAVTALGCRTVRCVTAPINKGSIAFHRRQGFHIEGRAETLDGISFAENYDGTGEDRVLFFMTLPHDGDGRQS